MPTLTDTRARVAMLAVGLLGFVATALLVQAGLTTAVDFAALDALASLHGRLDPLMVAISEFGGSDILAFFTMFAAGYLWARGQRWSAVFVALGYYLAALVVDVIKATFARPRPPVEYQIALTMPEAEDLIWAALTVAMVVLLWRTKWRWGAVLGATLFALTIFFDPGAISTPGSDAFPSGHAFRSMTLVLSVLFVRPSRFRRRTLVAYGAAVLAIGVSRVYLGQHHPSDVIAGWFGAIAMVSAMSLIPVFRPQPARGGGDVEGGPGPS